MPKGEVRAFEGSSLEDRQLALAGLPLLFAEFEDLAADPEAADLFEKLLKSKEEAPEVRRVCAVALNNLKPKAYQKFAQESVLDDHEHNAVRAQSLAALTMLGDSELLAGNDRLTDKVKKLRAGGPPAVKKAARQYLAKISDE